MNKDYYNNWYQIEEFPNGTYEINKMGQIRNKRTKNILKPQIKNAGYLVYTLYIDRKIYYRQAHILVARQFIPNPDNKPIVNHKDENKMNPCVDNLEWVTEIENANYGTSKKRGAKGKEKPVDEYSVDGIYIRTWRSTVSICLFFANDTDATALKNYITTILKYNKENEIKKTFANRVFMYSDKKYDNKVFEVKNTMPRKNKKLKITDDTIVSSEFLYDEEELQYGYIEVYMLSKEKLLPEPIKGLKENPFLDSYVIEFLDLPKNFKESDLRKGLIQNMKDFILEVGKDFIFIDEEYRVQVGGEDFRIDLLFFHRGLQCLVAFELKIGKFKPEYISKMDFYLEALDRQKKKENENPSVGMILCASKDDEVVEYAMSRTLSSMMVAEYKLQLPDKAVLQKKLQELINMPLIEE